MKHKLQTLLKHKLQWLMLLAALFGVSQGVLCANRNFKDGEYIYFVNYTPSGWSDRWITSTGKGYVYLCNGTSTAEWIQLTLHSGTAGANNAVYKAKISGAKNHKTYVFTRGSSSYFGGFNTDGFWNQGSDVTIDTGEKNKITSGSTQGYYAVKPKSVTITLSSSCYSSGSGTSVDPYIVTPGSELTFTVSVVQDDAGMKGIGASVNTNSSKEANAASTSVTVTKTASASNSKDENWTGYAWAYKYSTSYYSDSYTTSSDKVYTRTAAACTPPDAPEDVEADPSEICAGESTTLSASVGEGCTVKWYTVSTGGTPLASSTVSPAETATYYAEADNGSCASTTRTSVEVTVNALPSISLSGSGAVDATHTYPWEWMTVTATTSPSDLTVTWSASFAGPSGSLEKSMEEIGTPNHTYRVKSNRSLSADQSAMTIDVTGTVTDDATGCSNSAKHRFYNNQVPAETCN